MSHHPTHREKTRRAMQACIDLIDAAEWLKSELRPPLDSFDLTFGEFRLLELLNRKGPLTVIDAARGRKSSKQNVTGRIGVSTNLSGNATNQELARLT